MAISHIDKTGDEFSQNEDDNDAERAREVVKRDNPEKDDKATARKDEGSQVYRPEANVDNQKSSGSENAPHHNTSMNEAPYSGAQVVKEKTDRKENIDDKADKARSPRRNG